MTFAIRPPANQSFNCPTCGEPLVSVVIHEDADHGHVEPCGCRITPAELTALLTPGG